MREVTGYEDKHGRPILEGDIVASHGSEIHLIEDISGRRPGLSWTGPSPAARSDRFQRLCPASRIRIQRTGQGTVCRILQPFLIAPQEEQPPKECQHDQHYGRDTHGTGEAMHLCAEY
jgi:hypothetical protein